MRLPLSALVGACLLSSASSALASSPYGLEDPPPAPARMKSRGGVIGGSVLVLLGVAAIAVGVPVVVTSANDSCTASSSFCTRELGMGLGALSVAAGAAMMPAGSILIADGSRRVPVGAATPFFFRLPGLGLSGSALSLDLGTRPWVQAGHGAIGAGVAIELRH